MGGENGFADPHPRDEGLAQAMASSMATDSWRANQSNAAQTEQLRAEVAQLTGLVVALARHLGFAV